VELTPVGGVEVHSDRAATGGSRGDDGSDGGSRSHLRGRHARRTTQNNTATGPTECPHGSERNRRLINRGHTRVVDGDLADYFGLFLA
jgi:hypothetical protein